MVETGYIICWAIAFIAILGGIFTDIKSGQIPYVTTIPLLLSSLMIATINGTLLIAILSGILSLSILLIMGTISANNCGWNSCKDCNHQIGGGDMKLSAGLGVLLASPINVLMFLAISFGSGGMWALKSGDKKIKMGHWLGMGFFVAYMAGQMGLS